MIRLAAVLRQFLPDYDAAYSRSGLAHKVCGHIEACRTEALGGFQLHCQGCDQDSFLYHACRDRNCPRCQQRVSADWERAQLADVVDTSYFHRVFTLPHELNAWARLHPGLIYHTLFRAAWLTVNTLGQDQKRLGGQMGMTAVLHTWGQNLGQHIHLHCLIPGGALSRNGEWHPAKSTYLFPVKAVSRLFRGKRVSALRQALSGDEWPRLTEVTAASATLNQWMKKEWVVYARHALTKPESIVGYLARYTRKIALSESRLVNMDDETVSFRYRDYRDNQNKVMTLSGVEFVRRFLQHVLPSGFMRIRHYGWLSNASRSRKLPVVRAAIVACQQDGKSLCSNTVKAPPRCEPEIFRGIHCPHCKTGMRVIIGQVRPRQAETAVMMA